MNIHCIQVNPFGENCYIIEKDAHAILIDCGAYWTHDRQSIALCLRDHQLTPIAHLSTHGHLDHQFGSRWLYEQYGLLPTLHTDDADQLLMIEQQAMAFGLPLNEPPLTEYIQLNDESLARLSRTIGISIRLVHTPGHTRGSVCYLMEDGDERALFSGDTLFAGGYGRTDLPGGSWQQLMQSLQYIHQMPVQFGIAPTTPIYPGHGQSTNFIDF